MFCLSLKTEMYESIIVSIILCGHKCCSSPFREENTSRVFENGMQWKILEVD
jgi:hypothetical protein